MIAVVTSIHFSLWGFLKERHNRVIADIHKHRRLRRKQYADCLQEFSTYRCFFSRVYLLECSGCRPPRYLRKNPDLVCRVAGNQTLSPNKGVKEFANIAEMLKSEQILQEERVFKLTGRYILQSDAFLDRCHRSSADVVAKRDDGIWGTKGKGLHTFMFAAKAGVITSFADWLLQNDVRERIGSTPIEWIFLQYLEANGLTIDFYEGQMGLLANYAPPAKSVFV